MTADAQPTATKRQILELKYVYLRNTTDNMQGRTLDYLKSTHVPALQRAGAKSLGAFRSNIAPEAPFLLTVTAFESMAAYEIALDKLAADAPYQKQTADYNGLGLGYVRTETSLLRGFPTFPALQTPSASESPRLFELRRYESNSSTSLARKIRMFDEGEIAIFQKVGMLPIFFGETIVGPMQPNLVYMLAYPNMAEREKMWRDFVTSDDWKKALAQPGVSDGEIVSNISASLLSPLPFSPIK